MFPQMKNLNTVTDMIYDLSSRFKRRQQTNKTNKITNKQTHNLTKISYLSCYFRRNKFPSIGTNVCSDEKHNGGKKELTNYREKGNW